MADGRSVKGLRGVDKAALLLLALGPEAASTVLRHLGESEVRQVSRALAAVDRISSEQLASIGDDFKAKLSEGGLPVEGRTFAREMVMRAFADPGSPAAAARAEILAELEPPSAGPPAAVAAMLEGVKPDRLARLLQDEHPQIAALLLAHARPSEAVKIIEHLPPELQSDIVERIAALETAVPADLMAEVGAIFRDQVKGLARGTGASVGGPKLAAEMIRQADKAIEGRIMEEIEQRNQELGETIRGLMFTFEECVQLDNRSMQTLLKEVSREDLMLALKTASPQLQEKIFTNMSARASEILKEDMASAGPARLKDVEEAQQKIVAALRELEADGKVVVAGAGKGDELV